MGALVSLLAITATIWDAPIPVTTKNNRNLMLRVYR